MKTKSLVWVLEFKKVAYELSGPLAINGAPQVDNDSSNHPKKIYKNVFSCLKFRLRYIK